MNEHSAPPLRLAAVGCGARTRAYLSLAANTPARFGIVAAADPVASRVDTIATLSGNPEFQRFASADDLLAEPKLADILIVGTQDSYHVDPCRNALEKGYDVLLEKPISPHPEEIAELSETADRLGRRVMVCHVLRYTPFYETVKEIVASGRIGDVVTIQMTEGVGPWHYAHSYIRGHWSNRDTASPMILAKSCHDMDILSWLADRPCLEVASFGGLHHFIPNPESGQAGKRCSPECGCPVDYKATQYAGKQRSWLHQIMDGADNASEEDILQWLNTSPWGRCIDACDNNVVDRQVLALSFEGGITASFTMTAFDTGRNLEIFGTKGTLRGGEFLRRTFDCDLVLEDHFGGLSEKITVSIPEGGYEGHMGGDHGLMSHLYAEMTSVPVQEMRSSLDQSKESHFMAFAADRSRCEGRIVSLDEFRTPH